MRSALPGRDYSIGPRLRAAWRKWLAYRIAASAMVATAVFCYCTNALRLDERLRLALERGAAYYAECGPDVGNQEASRAADCGTLRRERLCQVLDLDSRQCEAIVDFSLSPSMELWSTTSAASVQGGESLVSKLFSANRDACIELSVLMPAGEVTFFWQVSSEQLFDRLVIQARRRVSGATKWQAQLAATFGACE